MSPSVIFTSTGRLNRARRPAKSSSRSNANYDAGPAFCRNSFWQGFFLPVADHS